jgi:hypothetical protein
MFANNSYVDITFLCKDIETIDIDELCYLNQIDSVSCFGLLYLLKDPLSFLNMITKIKTLNMFVLETVNYNELKDKVVKIDNHSIKLNKIDEIKNIFIKNDWQLKYEKNIKLNELDQKINSKLIFGDRVVLVFER